MLPTPWKFKNKFNSHKIFIRKRHAINLKINRMCLKNICYCIDSSHNATYEANYQVNMQGNPVFMMLSNSSLYIQSTHVLKKKEAKSKTGYQETHRSPELSKYF